MPLRSFILFSLPSSAVFVSEQREEGDLTPGSELRPGALCLLFCVLLCACECWITVLENKGGICVGVRQRAERRRQLIAHYRMGLTPCRPSRKKKKFCLTVKKFNTLRMFQALVKWDVFIHSLSTIRILPRAQTIRAGGGKRSTIRDLVGVYLICLLSDL